MYEMKLLLTSRKCHWKFFFTLSKYYIISCWFYHNLTSFCYLEIIWNSNDEKPNFLKVEVYKPSSSRMKW